MRPPKNPTREYINCDFRIIHPISCHFCFNFLSEIPQNFTSFQKIILSNILHSFFFFFLFALLYIYTKFWHKPVKRSTQKEKRQKNIEQINYSIFFVCLFLSCVFFFGFVLFYFIFFCWIKVMYYVPNYSLVFQIYWIIHWPSIFWKKRKS